MLKHALWLGLVLGASGAIACTGGPSDDTDTDTDTDTDSDTERPDNHEVVIVTRLGEIAIDVYDDQVPDAAASFRQYASDGFYDGSDGGRATLVHKVQSPLLFEAGIYETNLAEKAVGTPVANASDTAPSNRTGTVALVPIQGSGDHTAGFVINAQDNTYLDGDGADPGHTVIGEVVSGMDVVQAILGVDTESRAGFDLLPAEDIVLESVTVYE